MKILIVGAGAVGQVYGWYLKQAGHDVIFFVKPKYREQIEAGLKLHRLGYFGARAQIWPQVQVVTDPAEIARERWDQVWLTLASDALRGELAAQVLSAVGAATVVCLQPDMEDAAYVQAKVPAPAQVVQGLITFISYQSPLPGTTASDGMFYFLPPLAPALFSGQQDRVQSVVQALKDGGLPVRSVADVASVAAGATALMQPLIAALEISRWHLATLQGSSSLVLGLDASREALSVAKHEAGTSTGPFRPLLLPLTWRLILPVIQRLLPLPLEPYLRYHFTKVGAQTRLMLDTYIRLGKKHRLETGALQSLRHALPDLK